MSSDEKKINKEGLTNQEFSFKYSVPIESVISETKSHNQANKKLHIEKNGQLPLDDDQKTILKAYFDLGLLISEENDIRIYEDVRKLNYLFWIQEKLKKLNFHFVEENSYSDESHKIITKNYITIPKKELSLLEIKGFDIRNLELYISILLLQKGYASNNFIFLQNVNKSLHESFEKILSFFNINIKKLEINESSNLIRLATSSDCKKIRSIINKYLEEIPCLNEKFYSKSVNSSITKKLVFDSAHYISDHDGKCKNLHGGRYNIEISLKDRIDPMTGFIIDYSLIKKITKNLIINKFDHKTLNLTCSELAWRSSTEFLAIVIWEILIEYLPSLSKIKIFETETSFCEFEGQSLDEYLKNGPSEILSYFKNLSRNSSSNEDIGHVG